MHTDGLLHHHLRPLVLPRSVALVGASERQGTLGRIVFENVLAGDFAGGRQILLGQQHAEFVATESRQNVGLAKRT